MAKTLSLCLFLLASLAGAQAAPATSALVAEVQAALDKGDAGQAQRMADGALAGAGGTERAQLLLSRGLARELLGLHDSALADFTAAINSGALSREDRAQALLQRGFLHDGLGQLDAAARDYGAVIGLKTAQTATALNNRANIYRRQNRMAEARRGYLAALEAGSARSQYPYYGLGQIAEAEHDKDAARGLYAKAVAADPSYRLASERLEELGGPPEGALAEPDVIHLHPPGSEAAQDRPVTLKPPQGPQRIVLKPPHRRAARAAPRPVGLRPALDGASAVAAGPQIQLGAWRSEAEARAGWTKVQAKAGGLLEGLTPHIVTADLPGKGRYYRLRTAPGGGQSAGQLCAALAGRGLPCLVARN